MQTKENSPLKAPLKTFGDGLISFQPQPLDTREKRPET